MDELIKMILKRRGQENLDVEQIAKEIYDIINENDSEIDKWYKIKDAFWIRRTTNTNYMSAQVFPVSEGSFLCYLYIIDIQDIDKKQAEAYKENATPISDTIPIDIQYIYPVALSLDIEKAAEKFLASNEIQRNDWLNKLGIRGNE